jgi:hypothetical protein
LCTGLIWASGLACSSSSAKRMEIKLMRQS